MVSLRLAACAMLCAFITATPAAVVREKREIQTTTSSDSEKAVCQHRMPCGWAVCECSPNKNCVKTDDDLSISAYVFRCKENVTSEEETFASLSSTHATHDLTT